MRWTAEMRVVAVASSMKMRAEVVEVALVRELWCGVIV